MNQITKTDNPIINFSMMAGVLALLTAFCYFVDLSLIIPLLLTLVGYQLSLYRKTSVRLYMKLGLFIAVVAFGAHAVKMYTQWPFYIIPVASIPMMTMLLFDDVQMTFLISFSASAIATLVLGVELDYFLIFLAGGLIGSYVIKDARTRGQIINAGLCVGLTQVICGFFLNPTISQETILQYFQPLFLSGFVAAGVVLASLKVFEIFYGELTNFSLLELSDSLNQPLLKRMAVEAPGTYHHSLILANMSEAAVLAIDGNALLTRVGAYYHDIGKMVKPHYFTENQMMMGNKHDSLEPSMSRLVILNHVKEGVEMAKKHKLNQKIIDFIAQHHGTGLMHFFYQKALQESEDGETVDESEYRYPGPKPQTKETAVVLLADSVEGATRALDEHTPKKIDETVRKIINNKFIDGQLDECNLTLKEIEAISSAFTRVLSATYHGRVKYPDQNTNGNGHGNGNHNKKSDNQNDKPSSDQEKSEGNS